MTISYSRLVANGSSFGCFWSILTKWRGSVYKLVWRELFAYLSIYYAINLTYRFAMTEHQQRIFERVRDYCAKHSDTIPMSFVLGFYVTLVVKRWWEQYRLLPWPDTLALFVSAAIPGVHGTTGIASQHILTFEWLREYFAKNNLASTLMTFVMGFYVNLIVTRWWEQYRLLPWPDTLALFVSAAIQGQDERGRLMRRNIVRYAILAYVITLKHVSVRVKKRFPTLQHIVDAGIMLESEKKIVEMMDSRSPMAKYWMPLVWATNIINRARRDNLIMSDQLVQTLLFELSEHRRKLGSIISYDTVCVPLVYTQTRAADRLGPRVYRPPAPPAAEKDNQRQVESLFAIHRQTWTGLMMESEKKIFEMLDERHPMAKYWLPLTWATNVINRARRDGHISCDHLVQTIMTEMSDIRLRLGSLIGYDNVNVPLVYTQVVTLSVYSYFLANLLGKQFIVKERSPTGNIEFDMYFPIFTVLQFVFYVGWLKVAEVLIGPFGEDDDDIELNWLIDRHIKAAYMIVDEMHEEHPELLKDQYWDEVVPKDLPYTVASEHYRKYEPKGSAEDYKVKEQDALYANLLHSRKSINPDDVYADYESVDTPLVERRKNWFQRQMQRVGSIRSSSTAYSSGLFGRQRHNSVYSTPDHQNGLPIAMVGGAQSPVPPLQQNTHKMSIYDRLIGRKSTRQNRNRPGPLKMNGSVVMKNRPRIPTPDVTKEVVDRENRLAQMNLNNNNANNSGGSISPNSLVSALVAHSPVPYAADTQMPVAVQVVLSPIQESESHQSTITSNTPGASALAQAVLASSLNPAGLSTAAVLTTSHPINTSAVLTTTQHPITMCVSPVTFTTVSMSNPMLTSLGITPSPSSAPHTPVIAHRSLILTDVTHPSITVEEGSSAGSVSGDDRSRKTSVTSQPKRGEVYV